MSKKNSAALLKINSILGGEDKKYREFEKKVGKGGSFGNEEVKRAIAAGYSMDDVNDYLKYTGITPKGDFAVGGFNKSEDSIQNSPNVGGRRTVTSNDPYYRFVGATPAAPSPKPADTPKPAPVAPSTPAASPPTSVNPELAIPSPTPDMNVGDNVRLVGENLGIKAKRSSASKAKLTSKGTSRLTIPRSSGYQPVNMGV